MHYISEKLFTENNRSKEGVPSVKHSRSEFSRQPFCAADEGGMD